LTDSNKLSIVIPDDISEDLKKRAKTKGFKSLSDYVNYILRQVLAKIKLDEKQKKNPTTEEDDEEVKQKLKDLGYLN